MSIYVAEKFRVPTRITAIGIGLLLSFVLFGCSTGGKTEKAGEESTLRTEDVGPEKERPNSGDAKFMLSSESYAHDSEMPDIHATLNVTGGKNASPLLSWTNAPEGVESFALVMVDEHPAAGGWLHWVVVNISKDASAIPEGGSMRSMPVGSLELMNSFGAQGYGGPEPPTGGGPHRYVITLYALNSVVALDPNGVKTKVDLEKKLSNSIIVSAEHAGNFGR